MVAHVARPWLRTPLTVVPQVAVLLAHINAALAIRGQPESRRASTGEASVGVGANSAQAQLRDGQALVHVLAVSTVVRQLESLRTGALKRALGVTTGALLAHVAVALVDVNASSAVFAELVSLLALTLETADSVPATTVVADAVLRTALVHVRAVVVRRELEARIADTTVGSRLVLADSIGADSGTPRAFVVIDAGVSSWRCIIARIAGALEAAVQVYTYPVLADAWLFITLVHIFAVAAVRRKLVAVGTLTLVASVFVHAGGRAGAQTRHRLTLVNVFAHVQMLVVVIAGVTDAVEAAHGVGAVAIVADHALTFVHIVQYQGDRVQHGADGGDMAQLDILGRVRLRTGLAVVTPGLADRTAARHLGLVGHHGVAAHGGLLQVYHVVITVAEVLPHIYTGFASRNDYVARRTVARVAAIAVVTGAGAAGIRVQLTLIHVDAVRPRVVQVVPFGAHAVEAPERVGAAAVTTHVHQIVALVHIFKIDADLVRPVAWATGTQFLVGSGVGRWADVARASPGSSDGAAARGASHGLPHGRCADATAVEVGSDVAEAQFLPGVYTTCLGWREAVVRRALADVGARRVDTSTMHARFGTCALVDIRTVTAR